MLQSRGCDFARALRSLLRAFAVVAAVVVAAVVVVASELHTMVVVVRATPCLGTVGAGTGGVVVGILLLWLRLFLYVADPSTLHVAVWSDGTAHLLHESTGLWCETDHDKSRIRHWAVLQLPQEPALAVLLVFSFAAVPSGQCCCCLLRRVRQCGGQPRAS